MNIIICGAGKVGFSISKQLSAQGHSVTVIDQSSEDIKKINDTQDVKGIVGRATLPSVLENAGADIVRVSCPDKESTKALKNITKEVSVPIVADIHFHYKRAIEAAEMGASCLRINPGNIGTNNRVLFCVNTIATTINIGAIKKYP